MAFSKTSSPAKLALIANTLRTHIISMVSHAQSGHPGGSLGMADVFATLYFSVLNHDPKKPKWESRDRVVLSNGHICPVLYATLAECGYFPKKELLSFRLIDSRLQGHPHYGSLPGIESSTGPLGQGIAAAVGMAFAQRLSKSKSTIYAFVGDGELNEGVCWESFLLAGAHHLSNLCVIVDRNDIQIDGHTHDVLPTEPLAEKFSSFGFEVISINGHDYSEILCAFKEQKTIKNHPTVIIAHTVPGKGVMFMENNYHWHGKAPSKEQATTALLELAEERKLLLNK